MIVINEIDYDVSTSYDITIEYVLVENEDEQTAY